MRFSISVLMAVILLFGIVFGASAYGGVEPMQGVILFTACIAVLCVLCTAILGVVYRRGEKRAFWVGFAVYSWASVLVGWLLLGHYLSFFAFLASLPLGYIGGTIGRRFAAEGAKGEGPATRGLE